jgi:predicted O-methyltransferase YrrM
MNSFFKNCMESLIAKIPYVGKWRSVFLKHSTPGHYYSPIPDVEAIRNNEAIVFNMEPALRELDMNQPLQISLLSELDKEVKAYPYSDESNKQKYRYTESNNIYYTFHDAALLFGLMKIFRPKKIIEIGSGFSSALMMDTNEFFLGNSADLIFIEPYPEERLNNFLQKDVTNVILKKEFIQDVPLDFFRQLQAGDFLFVDSSHVSKINSDLNYIIFEIMPVLCEGVIIHFHDVHYPFEYPKEWVFKGYFWNESYMLHSFLMYNSAFEIIFMNSYLSQKFPEQYSKVFGGKLNISEAGAIWLKKK